MCYEDKSNDCSFVRIVKDNSADSSFVGSTRTTSVCVIVPDRSAGTTSGGSGGIDSIN